MLIPVGNSFIYVQPLYIQATGNSLPELKRVIVATEDNIAMAATFAQALSELVGTELEAPTPPPGQPGVPLPIAELAAAIERAFAAAEGAARSGDWAQYGLHLQELGRLIAELRQLKP